ncbi:MAG TPA: hypothetical protein VHQ90_12990 [Thermoanaerobaculia bacterium]|nr:hypothetical protein [Thermoanaerobaculia bacterium]
MLRGGVAVTVAWHNQFDGTAGQGTAAALSDESGSFSFTSPSNVELLVKALDFGGAIKFYYGALSDLEYKITVVDTSSGAVKTYHNSPGRICGGIDNFAF